MRVDEYLRYCARLHRIARAEVEGALVRAKARCGIEAVGGRLIGNLSKGYQQRVGIAQAILHAPEVVVLDEPTVGLDPIQIREIRALIRELRDEHSVILSTHILPEVQALCDRVLIIHQGRRVLDEAIEDLTRRHAAMRLRIALRRPPQASEIRAVEGVEAVEPLDGERFLLYHSADRDPVDALVELAASRGWGLYELIPESRTLEETFVQLTCGDASPATLAEQGA
jgi:ABC-2 type transport system ATP-binding protein